MKVRRYFKFKHYLMVFTVLGLLGACGKRQLPAPDNGVLGLSSLDTGDPLSYDVKGNQVKASSKAEADQLALLMYRRLVGVSIPVGSEIIQSMSNFIFNGQPEQAASIALNEPNFLNITVKYMGIKMSYKDESPNHPANDFAATLVGAVRDDVSAFDLLTGNFTYRVDPQKVPQGITIRSDVYNDVLRSNNMFEDLDKAGFNFNWLIRYNKMEIVGGDKIIRDLPDKDASPLITSRAFTAAHAIAGTNRRIFQYSFKEFLCRDVIDFADTTMSDQYIGRDVSRFDAKYQTKCKGCHSIMDGMRGAFANIDFFDNGSEGFLKHSQFLPGQPRKLPETEERFRFKTFWPIDGSAANRTILYPGVAAKMNHNEDKFPAGYIIDSDMWVNLATGSANQKYFGWRGEMRGNGVKSFARMIASSERFGKCMAEKVFIEVCKRKPNVGDEALIAYAGKKFEMTGYKFKDLFQLIGSQQECLGK